MNTLEVKSILSKNCRTKSSFGGVYPSDVLPKTVKEFPQSFVANVDPSTQAGSHWVAFYFTSEQKGEFFDSYGLSPQSYSEHFEEFLNENAVEWTFNSKHLQSLFTDVCGHYCIFYIYHRCNQFAMHDIVKLFNSKIKEENDSLVRYYVESYLVQNDVVKCLSNVQSCKSLH